ncbi:MAG: methyltransferase [Bacteroidales bacterium]|nr:methyltransferase [Bacteroidales bacterium]MCF8456203.1 methyltransferase [Bacteroidales bacterium]
MANPWFTFKQFTVWHDKTAMKVGTDGVLLGAWADASCTSSLLDVGTGTGLIALMMAQRFPTATIHAIDIDPDSVSQAVENFERSPWPDRLSAHLISFQELASEGKMKFDHIVSNPPYFKNSLHAPDFKRTMARHDSSLSFGEIIRGSVSILKPQGKLSLIVPFEAVPEVLDLSTACGLFCTRQLLVKPNPTKGVIRALLEIGFSNLKTKTDTLVIEEEKRHNYSQAYKELTNGFYLRL